MCPKGYCIKYDERFRRQKVREMAFFLHMEETNVDSIITKLIDNHFFYIIKDETIVDGEYLTCCQQIYNYEMAANRKKSNNERQQKKREKDKAKQQAANNEVPYYPPTYPDNSSPQNSGYDYGYPNNNDYSFPQEDNPFY